MLFSASLPHSRDMNGIESSGSPQESSRQEFASPLNDVSESYVAVHVSEEPGRPNLRGAAQVAANNVVFT